MNCTPVLKTKTFSNVCRLCLQSGNLFLIDKIDWESCKLNKLLSQWIFFDKMGEGKLPQKVCKLCIKWVYNTDYFLKQIQRNQEILQYSLSYELSGASEREDSSEANTKQEKVAILEIEFKETNEEIVINYYCEADKSILEETNQDNLEDHDYGKDDISSFLCISSVPTDPENSNELNDEKQSSNPPGFKFKDKTNDYINEIATKNAIACTSSFPTAANNKDVVAERKQKPRQEPKVDSQLHLECFNYFCGACEQGFKTDEELLLHKKLIKSHVYGGCIFICHPCKFRTKDRSKFQIHMYCHQNIKPHQCSMCGKTFRALGDLQRHTNKVHLNVRKPKCKFCYKIFKDKESCNEHEKSHENIYYICSICGISFKVWEKWFGHERAHKLNVSGRKRTPTNTKAIKTPCDICKEMFASKSQMVAHRISKHNGDHFICKICNHKVKTFESFENHMLTHKGLRESHQCNYCGKSFIDVKWYRSHLKLHTNETAHKCPYCNKPCINKKTLTIHLRTHTGEKSQKCTLCPKVFASSINLKIHLKTHAGPPNFKCSLCPRAFYMNYLLQRHIRKKHPGQNLISEKNSDSESNTSGSERLFPTLDF